MLQLSSRQLLLNASGRSINTRPLRLQSVIVFPSTRQHLSSIAAARQLSPTLSQTVKSSTRPSCAQAPLRSQWVRYSAMRSSGPPVPPPKNADASVSSVSTTRSVFDEVGDEGDAVDQARSGTETKEKAVPVSNAIVTDLRTIKETFALREVPREALVLGLAGLIPYVTSSLTTVFCAWDVNYAQHHGTGFLISEEQATVILQFLEPIQIGYGAVILSFLGAVHWGLEWAKFGGVQGYRRYFVGMAAPIIAWPTVFFPYEYALITQFLGFTYLYYSDATATARGWTPQWYGTYRFVLTFIAGASIVISLIGRGEIGDVMERRQMGIQTTANPGKALKVRGEQDGELARDQFEAKRAKVYDQIEEAKKAERTVKDKNKHDKKEKDDDDEEEEEESDDEGGKEEDAKKDEDGDDKDGKDDKDDGNDKDDKKDDKNKDKKK